MFMDRRSGIERRKTTVTAYWHGAFNPRRRNGRRSADVFYPIVDWHSARVFALVVGILGLCVLDGVLTVMLMTQGAIEVNPLLAMFLPHELGQFAAVKLTLTAVGVLVLVACSRMRLFRRVPGEFLLYAVLACYATLIAYQLQLLKFPPLYAA
jgi:hypothetical protein